ncbi:DUF1569 domain-containing protein [Spirosoma aerolatum]|uniref:DUF1569 domain-containing protein n=1 Tax=Spirosoma aerolatum TaxID=1211326 RepID=UPI0009AC9797|nr:DUF1569 domain-containing protein [Spirosoma aerolatum]
MRSLYETNSVAEILSRIDRLRPDSQRQWGKMDVAQMLAHCSVGMETATGQKKLPRLFIGRILAPFVKTSFYNEKPFNRNGPTHKDFVVADQRVFEAEKEKLVQLVKQFSAGGPAACTTHPHSFFGELTPEQWSIGMYKHLDHHLRQFGV